MSVPTRLESLLQTPAVEAARRTLPPPAHLVGGCVRDALLGVSCRDLDVVVGGDPLEEIRRLATTLEARLVDLSSGRFPTLRLVIGDLEIDVWRRGDLPLEDELRRRDLTINAIGWDLHDEVFVDPCGGLPDLSRRRLRVPRPEVLAEDPLRVLRLVRFAAQLPTFDVDPTTLRAARRRRTDLSSVASERIREELSHLFEQPAVERGLELAVRIGLYPALWGEDHHPESPAAGERAISTLERLSETAKLVGRLAPSPVLDLPLARLAASVRATLDPDASRRHLLDRGYVTRETERRLRALVAETGLPGDERERRRFIHRTGDLWPTAAALLLAERGPSTETAGERSVATLVDLWTEEGERLVDPPRLVRGDEAAEILDLEPGPALGEAMERLRLLQVDGMVSSREEALARLREWSEEGGR